MVLAKDQPSPFAPESDEEKVTEAAKPDDRNQDAAKADQEGPVLMKVDFEELPSEPDWLCRCRRAMMWDCRSATPGFCSLWRE